MNGDPGTDTLPRLIVVYSMTTLVLQLLEAAAGCWTYLWLINRGDEGVEPALRLLNRTGIVVDGTGRSSAEKAALLATFGPSGIIAFDDEKLVLAAELAQHLGLLANSPAATMRLVNKIAQRKALQAAGLPVPAFWDVQATADIAERQRIVETVSYPVIVKPQADAGSRNTYRADEEKTLTALLDQASTSSGRAEAVIVEGLLTDGWSRDAHPYADFVSVESAVCEGRPGHFAVTGRSTLAEPYRATGSFIPSNLPRDILAEICSLTTEALLALDVTTGIYHTEVKLTRDGPRIIEVNGRVGGSIPELVSLAGRALNIGAGMQNRDGTFRLLR